MRLKLSVLLTLSLVGLAISVAVTALTSERANANPEAVAQEVASTSTAAPSGTLSAGSSSAAVTPSTQELYEGVWNGGQASTWDMKEIDLFSPFPQGYRPEQPIKYSHAVHIQKAGMECTYCHSGVTKSSFATMPSVELCMGCHAQVKTDSPEIKKLKALYDQKKPVEWEPVNNLPEYAHFNHERHIKGGVGCQSCHGQVGKMDVVEKAASLKMGFCIDCHRHKGATIDCVACHY